MDQLYFVVHTHWDREWYQPFQQMRARLVTMADRMIPLVERGTIPSFHFDGQTIVLDDYLEMRPRAEPRLRSLIRAGKIQVGPWYVLADSFLVSGESLIRNLEIGMAIARRFGRPLDVGYLPDQFGHIAQMPQILAGFGFTTAVLWRGVGARRDAQSLHLGSARRQFGADGLPAQRIFQRRESAARIGGQFCRARRARLRAASASSPPARRSS